MQYLLFEFSLDRSTYRQTNKNSINYIFGFDIERRSRPKYSLKILFIPQDRQRSRWQKLVFLYINLIFHASKIIPSNDKYDETSPYHSYYYSSNQMLPTLTFQLISIICQLMFYNVYFPHINIRVSSQWS